MEMMKACFAPGVKGLLAPLQGFLEDEAVSEILINRPQEVFVERENQMLRFEIPVFTTQYLRRLFQLIANENRQVLSESLPILSGNLEDGSRVQLVIPEASLHETLSIRKFTLKSMDFEDYAKQGFFNVRSEPRPLGSGNSSTVPLPNGRGSDSPERKLQDLYQEKNWQTFIEQAVLLKKNILISGATSSGKTTFLNACVNLIPQSERLIILEDTYEIKAPHLNMVRLKALKQTGENQHSITMQDLVQASLRLRPDRIIMGEIRGKEVFDFVSACETGHNGALATIHANNPKVAFMRMAQLYKLNNVAGMLEEDIYKILHEVIDIVLQVQKTDRGRQLVEVYYKNAS